MTKIYTDDDADLALVQQRNVTVLGDGEAVLAHALSLRDSGVDVRVGLPDGANSRDEAEVEGLRVLAPYEACEESDLLVMVGPGSLVQSLYESAVEPNLVDGDAVLFGRGREIRFRQVKPPDGVDVAMVSPRGSAAELRREFDQGRGVPVLVAVEQDATGTAWELALSYAKAIGGTRAGAIATTFAQEAVADVFAEQAVLGGVTGLVRVGFETLVNAGCQPAVAYFACLDALQQAVELPYVGDSSLAGQRILDKPARARLRRLLNEVRRGQFADADRRTPPARHGMVTTADELRRLLGWPRPTDEEQP